MLDQATPSGRMIAAAMKLAAERPWREIALLDIAEGAGLTLAEVRTAFHDKADLVRGFIRATDDAVLRQVKKPQPSESARDALFEVIMARLDLLAPYKPAIRSILEDAEPDPRTLRAALNSQYWMLQAAGVDAAGARGRLRTLGLASVYASVLRTWLEDDDPGQARTMAALDRRLRRGERSLKALDGALDAAQTVHRRARDLFMSGRRAVRRREETPRPPPQPPENGEPARPAGPMI